MLSVALANFYKHCECSTHLHILSIFYQILKIIVDVFFFKKNNINVYFKVTVK